MRVYMQLNATSVSIAGACTYHARTVSPWILRGTFLDSSCDRNPCCTLSYTNILQFLYSCPADLPKCIDSGMNSRHHLIRTCEHSTHGANERVMCMRKGLGRTAEGLTAKGLVRTAAASIRRNPSNISPGVTKVIANAVHLTITGRVELGTMTS